MVISGEGGEGGEVNDFFYCCLKHSEKYVLYINDENKLTNNYIL